MIGAVSGATAVLVTLAIVNPESMTFYNIVPGLIATNLTMTLGDDGTRDDM